MSNRTASSVAKTLIAPIASLNWSELAATLDRDGAASLGALLSPAECLELRALYQRDENFRSRVVMARHGFGSGEYKYFAHPLPPMVTSLRTALWPHLRDIANTWNDLLGQAARYPADHRDYLATCHAAGQTRPTPLMLKYVAGDYNCLHQDLYGAHVFPLQAVVLLSDPATEFSGGEFVMTEQRPRMQSRASVYRPCQGEVVVFAVYQRPVQGRRGIYRVNMRHGVSRLMSGERYTLGIIFHDAG